VDRAALGLSALKPSEMIEGLDRVAERAAKLEEREEAKRKAGGRMSDAAVLTDDTGRRWKRNVNLAIISTLLIGGLVGGAMFWWSNRQTEDPRKLRAETQETLTKFMAMGNRLKGFEDGDSITPEKARDAFLKLIESDLKTLNDEMARDKERKSKDGKFRTPDRMMTSDLASLTKLQTLKDAWGHPLDFSMADADTVKVSSKGAPNVEALEPVTVRLRAASKPAPEKDKGSK
jgi:hypothetical protein